MSVSPRTRLLGRVSHRVHVSQRPGGSCRRGPADRGDGLLDLSREAPVLQGDYEQKNVDCMFCGYRSRLYLKIFTVKYLLK